MRSLCGDSLAGQTLTGWVWPDTLRVGLASETSAVKTRLSQGGSGQTLTGWVWPDTHRVGLARLFTGCVWPDTHRVGLARHSQGGSGQTLHRVGLASETSVVKTKTWIRIVELSPSLGVQDLLYRRTRSLANAESANKKLETAKTKNKGVQEVSCVRRERSGAQCSEYCIIVGRGHATDV